MQRRRRRVWAVASYACQRRRRRRRRLRRCIRVSAPQAIISASRAVLAASTRAHGVAGGQSARVCVSRLKLKWMSVCTRPRPLFAADVTMFSGRPGLSSAHCVLFGGRGSYPASACRRGDGCAARRRRGRTRAVGGASPRGLLGSALGPCGRFPATVVAELVGAPSRSFRWRHTDTRTCVAPGGWRAAGVDVGPESRARRLPASPVPRWRCRALLRRWRRVARTACGGLGQRLKSLAATVR